MVPGPAVWARSRPTARLVVEAGWLLIGVSVVVGVSALKPPKGGVVRKGVAAQYHLLFHTELPCQPRNDQNCGKPHSPRVGVWAGRSAWVVW